MKKTILSAAAALIFIGMSATEPSGYYTTCEGKGGQTLLTALRSKIASHTTISYKEGLNSLFEKSDAREDGTVWDMYSTVNFPFSKRCGNYKDVGDCWNKEHSFPKSWFDDASPMYSDAFHLYPTDGKVNGQRSNYPYGECANGTRLDSRALGKLGSATNSGYSGTVFEPDDRYKGDFARSYFYMAACYNDKISGWDSPMLAGNSFPCFKQWAIDLLLKWHRQDPVSEKERNRQEAVYKEQKNRNPFIDHPEMVEYIWGNKSSQTWSSSGTTANPVLNEPVNGTTVEMGVTTPGKSFSVLITVNGTDISTDLPVSVSGTGFSCAASKVAASEANKGCTLTVSFSSQTVGIHTGTLTVGSGDLKAVVTLKATVNGTITALEAVHVESDAFTARWVALAGAGDNYQLHVTQAGTEVAGYPVSVDAEAGEYTVYSLEPDTRYKYYLTSGTYSSNVVDVKTRAIGSEVELTGDQPLEFEVAKGEVSNPGTVIVNVYNTDTDCLDISVKAPFEVSTDRLNWSNMVTMDVEDGQFFVRLNAIDAEEGEYYASLRVFDSQNGAMLDDRTEVYGSVTNGDAGIDTAVRTQGWSAWGTEGALHFDNGGDMPLRYQLYTLDGRCLFTGLAAMGVTSRTLTPGFYIVVSGQDAYRVVVK